MPIHRYRLFVIAFISLLYLLACATRDEVFIYDEGIIVYSAERILNGEIPYRDFWDLYAPGQFYTLALVFKIFGTSLLIERLWGAIVRLLLCWVIYQLTEKLTSPNIAMATWLLSVPVLGATGFYGYPMFTALVFILLSALCFLNFLLKEQQRWLVLCGLSTGVAALYRHDVGFYAFVAEVIVIVAFSYSVSRDRSSRPRRPRFLHSFFSYVGAVAIPFGLMTAYLLSVVPIRDLWESLFVFPATVVLAVRSLPYPPLIPDPRRVDFERWLRFYFPLLVFLGGCVEAALMFRKSDRLYSERIRVWGIVLLTLLGLGLFIQSVSRADSIHMLPTRIPAFILLITLLFPTIARWIEGRGQTVGKVGLVFLLLALPFLFMQIQEWSTESALYLPFDCPSRTKRAGCIPLSADQELAVQFIQEKVPKGSPIFVGLSRHDRIFINDALFYFLSERQSATKYHHLAPGSATTLPVQERIMDDIQRAQVRYIVLFSGSEHVVEPNEGGVSSGVQVLDDFIQENFSVVRQFGNYSILRKTEG